jgi:hypothetical protein
VSAERRKPTKRKTITFDPPEEVRLLLERAKKATGADITTLIVEALRTDLEKVVRRLIAERRKAEEEFLSQIESQDQAKKKAAS